MRSIAERCEAPPFTITACGSAVRIAFERGGTNSAPSDEWTEAHVLARLLRTSLAQGAASITVDLERSPHASTSMLAVIIDARRQARRGNATLEVRGSPALGRLAAIYGLEEMLVRP